MSTPAEVLITFGVPVYGNALFRVVRAGARIHIERRAYDSLGVEAWVPVSEDTAVLRACVGELSSAVVGFLAEREGGTAVLPAAFEAFVKEEGR